MKVLYPKNNNYSKWATNGPIDVDRLIQTEINRMSTFFFFHFFLFPTDVIESLIVGILFSCQVTVKLNI